MIYFIRCGEQGPVKIGYTSGKAEHRLQAFQTGHYEPLALLGAVEGDRNVETELHERFAAYRVRGEWFRPEPDMLAYIEGAVRFGRVSGTVDADEECGPQLPGGLDFDTLSVITGWVKRQFLCDEMRALIHLPEVGPEDVAAAKRLLEQISGLDLMNDQERIGFFGGTSDEIFQRYVKSFCRWVGENDPTSFLYGMGESH